MKEKDKKTYSSAIMLADNYTRWVVDKFSGYIAGSILEVGFGHESYRKFLPRVDSYAAADIDAAAVDDARKRDPENFDSYYVWDVTDESRLDSIGKGKYQTVMCVNMLEHVECDKKGIDNMLNLLAPGGHLLLFVPAFMGLYSDMDKLAGHYRRYTITSVKDLFSNVSADIQVIEYFNSVGGFGWWINKFYGHEDLDSKSLNRQIILFDRYILPISKLLNPLTRFFFGQSIICVIKKV